MDKDTVAPEDLHNAALQLAAGELPPGWDIVPSSTMTRVACNKALQVHYKQFLQRSPLGRLHAWLLGSRASRARRQNEALLFVGIEAPENLCWGKLPGGGEYLFTRTSPGQSVATWLKNTLVNRAGDTLATRRQLLEALGVFIGRVHATGFIPGDLKASDVFADLVEERFQFALVDNEFTLRKLPPPGRSLLKNLMQLNLLPPAVLSRTDRMRFFVAWRRQMRDLSPIEAKVVAAEAYHQAMQHMYEGGML